MNINVNKDENSFFSIEDVVSYSNIEITHVNDNKAPVKVVAVKVIVWAVIIAAFIGLLLI